MDDFDNDKRKRLVEKIESLVRMSDEGNALPAVSLEEFFEGNNDYGSIGCNLSEEEHPGPQGFYQVLRAVRARPDVQDVLVEIYEVGEDTWPFSERVFILTSAAPEEVAEWMTPLTPDEVAEGFPFGKSPAGFPPFAAGMTEYAVWWD